MDWELAIKRNREALLGVVAGFIILVGRSAVDPRDKPEDDALYGDTTSLPRRLRLAVLRILRPAESALRRLIVIVAAMRTTKAKQAAGRDAGAPLPDFSSFAQNKPLPAFRLADPRKRFGDFRPRAGANLGIPRISVPGFMEPEPIKPRGEDTVNAAAILRRIAALDHALKTLPRQARRLNRLMARRAKARQASASPLRRGLPPGWRRRPVRDVYEILHECHGLARDCGFKPP